MVQKTQQSPPLRHTPESSRPSGLEEATEDFWTPKYPQASATAQAEVIEDDECDISATFHIPKITIAHRKLQVSQQLNELTEELSTINGFIAASIADAESGMSLATKSITNTFDIEVAAAANAKVVRAKNAAVQALHLHDDKIEDILITLTNQYHLIRLSSKNPMLFIYLALDRKKANLALARHMLNSVESKLNI